MSFSGIQATINFYTVEQADLTNELTGIMQDITAAGSQTTLIADSTSKKRSLVEQTCSSGTDAYQNQMNNIENDYELEMSKINSWENQLEVKKQQLETELQATTNYKESFTSALKQNVQADFKYAQGGS